MSIVVDTCEEQYLTIEQLLRLVIFCNDSGNQYVNTCDSGLNPEDLLQLDCDEQYPIRSLLKQIFNEDDSSIPCIQFVTTDN
jgi:hypothetical protein